MDMSRRNMLKMLGVGAAATALKAQDRGDAAVLDQPDDIAVLEAAPPPPSDYDKALYVQVNSTKCRGCGRCNYYCPTGIIQKTTGGKYQVRAQDGCVHCAQCLKHCSGSAIYEGVSFNDTLSAALKSTTLTTVAVVAPAVRYGIAEAFGGDGTYAWGKTVTALRRLGFDLVWDNEFGADTTIWEEATEFIQRVQKVSKKPLPQFTSCCPAWVKYAESFYPKLLPNLSSCKSPIGMMGALVKSYGAKNKNIDASKLFTVAIMPCVAKKFEALRPEMTAGGSYRGIDAVIDTRELVTLIKNAKLDWATLPDGTADPLMGQSTGGGTIFGATGGVSEAAMRYAYEKISGQQLTNVNFTTLRGLSGVRTADIAIPNGPTVKVAMVSGLANVKKICDQVVAGTSPYHLIEVMACLGGCVNGGGQLLASTSRATQLMQSVHVLAERMKSLV